MFVKDMADLFPAFEDEDWREFIEADFAALGVEDAARYFAGAERILSSYVQAAESLDACLYVALSEAKARAGDARAVAEGYARGGAESMTHPTMKSLEASGFEGIIK